jgi:GTP-binding protein HflX
MKGLMRLYRRRLPSLGGYSKEQAWEMAQLTAATGRQIGLLVDRQGRPTMVISGESDRIVIPELGRQRQNPGRMRGLRLLHTHLSGSGLSQEDLMDLVFLRLDSIGVLNIDSEGSPRSFQWAHLLPPNTGNEFYWISDLQPWDRVETDFSQQVQALEEEFFRSREASRSSGSSEKALLVSVGTESKKLQEHALQELSALARTAGLEPTGTLVQRVGRMNPRHILGKGKLAELEVTALRGGAGALVFNCELTPAQMRNLADITERKILDRTQVILDIFAQHASSKEGKLQVELAQLDYTLPRLVGKNRALSRLAGGIGGRGPGETKLELDRRRIRDRKTRLKKEIAKVRQQRGSTRSRRDKAGIPIVSLVGYTNAGKSTLLNTLTQSAIYTADKLFATLDPTSRVLPLGEERKVIMTDTVGFIRFLPENLKESFLATLEELAAADVLIQVADASHSDVEEQVKAVDSILREMGLDRTPRILALNKWDLLEGDTRQTVANIFPHGIPVSALEKSSLDRLLRKILATLPARSLHRDEAAV